MEFLDIVDDQDEVVGKASIKEIYDKKLPHRIIHVLIFNSEGKIVLQMRSKEKKFCPQHWCTSVGGHVSSGESYEEAAGREFEEELGKSEEISLIGNDVYEDGRGLKKFLRVFKTTFDGPFEINQEEVESVDYFSLEEIQEMINKGEKFHPELLFLLEKYFMIKKSG